MLKQLKLTGALIPFAIAMLAVQPAVASPVTYTFTGVASGTGTGNASDFTDASVTAIFMGDTTDIDTSNTGFPQIHNLVGTITIDSYSGTFVLPITVEASSGLDNIDFYDAAFTNGLGFASASFAGYDLSTSIGPIAADVANLTPTTGPSSFSLSDGSTISFTGNTSLTFQAVVQGPNGIPEPLTLTLFGAGLGGIGAMRRRKRTS